MLRHIANRAFNIPPTIDVLYCEQEVIADNTPAVEVVLNADVKCRELQIECKKLEELTEQGDTTIQNRLQEVIIIYFFKDLFFFSLKKKLHYMYIVDIGYINNRM